MAIVQQFIQVLVTALLRGVNHILLKRIKQIEQWLHGNVVQLNLARQCNEQGLPLIDRGLASDQCFTILPEQKQSMLGCSVTFVSKIVCRACKVINGRNGRAQTWRAQPTGDRKVFVVVLHA